MIIKATWRTKNPFEPDPDKLGYTKTVEVLDDTDMEVIKNFAIEDTAKGYVFVKLEKVNEKTVKI